MMNERGYSRYKYIFIALLFVCILTGIDQGLKLLAVRYLKNVDPFILIRRILEFRYVENRGIAFGMMQGKRLFFILFCMVFLTGGLYVMLRLPIEKRYYDLWILLTVMCSGALGNCIDRMFRGYVVDFIYIRLVDFPVFNLADIYVVCAGVLFVLLLFTKYKDEDFDFLK